MSHIQVCYALVLFVQLHKNHAPKKTIPTKYGVKTAVVAAVHKVNLCLFSFNNFYCGSGGFP